MCKLFVTARLNGFLNYRPVHGISLLEDNEERGNYKPHGLLGAPLDIHLSSQTYQQSFRHVGLMSQKGLSPKGTRFIGVNVV